MADNKDILPGPLPQASPETNTPIVPLAETKPPQERSEGQMAVDSLKHAYNDFVKIPADQLSSQEQADQATVKKAWEERGKQRLERIKKEYGGLPIDDQVDRIEDITTVEGLPLEGIIGHLNKRISEMEEKMKRGEKFGLEEYKKFVEDRKSLQINSIPFAKKEERMTSEQKAARRLDETEAIRSTPQRLALIASPLNGEDHAQEDYIWSQANKDLDRRIEFKVARKRPDPNIKKILAAGGSLKEIADPVDPNANLDVLFPFEPTGPTTFPENPNPTPFADTIPSEPVSDTPLPFAKPDLTVKKPDDHKSKLQKAREKLAQFFKKKPLIDNTKPTTINTALDSLFPFTPKGPTTFPENPNPTPFADTIPSEPHPQVPPPEPKPAPVDPHAKLDVLFPFEPKGPTTFPDNPVMTPFSNTINNKPDVVQPEPEPEGPEPEGSEKDILEEINKGVVIANADQDMEGRARAIAKGALERLQNSNEGLLRGFFRKKRLQVFEQYYLQRFSERVVAEMRRHNTTFLEMDITLKAARAVNVRRVDEDEYKKTREYKLEELQSKDERAQAGREATASVDKITRQAIIDNVLLKFVRGELNGASDAETEKNVTKALQEVLKNNMMDPDVKRVFGNSNNFTDQTEFFASNLIDIGKKINLDDARHRKALSTMDIRIANPDWATGNKESIKWWQQRRRNKVLAVLTNPALMSIGSTIGTYALQGIGGSLARRGLNLVAPGLGSVVGGGLAAYREMRAVQSDLRSMRESQANGIIPEKGKERFGRNRDALKPFLYNSASVKQLIEGTGDDLLLSERKAVKDKVVRRSVTELIANVDDDQMRKQLVSRIQEIRARQAFADRYGVSVIRFDDTYSPERGRVELERAISQANKVLRDKGYIAEANAILAPSIAPDGSVPTGMDNWTEILENDRQQKDAAFRKYLLRRSLGAGARGAGLGFIFGLGSQEALAGISRGAELVHQWGNGPLSGALSTALQHFKGETNIESAWHHLAPEKPIPIPHSNVLTADILSHLKPGTDIALKGGLRLHYDSQGFSFLDSQNHKDFLPQLSLENGHLIMEGTSPIPAPLQDLTNHGFQIKDLGPRDYFPTTSQDIAFYDKAQGLRIPTGTELVDVSRYNEPPGTRFDLVDKKNPDIKLFRDAYFDHNTGKFISSSEMNQSVKIQDIFEQKTIPDGFETRTETVPYHDVFEKYTTHIDKQEWYGNNTRQSDFNELRGHTFREGNGVRIRMINMQDSYQNGLSPENVQVNDLMQQNETAFNIHRPGFDDIIIRSKGDILFDPTDTDPSKVIEVFKDGKFQTVPQYEIARLLVSVDKMNELGMQPGTDIHTDTSYDRQKIWTIQGENGQKGTISFGRLVHENGQDTWQSFTTMSGRGEVPQSLTISHDIPKTATIQEFKYNEISLKEAIKVPRYEIIPPDKIAPPLPIVNDAAPAIPIVITPRRPLEDLKRKIEERRAHFGENVPPAPNAPENEAEARLNTIERLTPAAHDRLVSAFEHHYTSKKTDGTELAPVDPTNAKVKTYFIPDPHELNLTPDQLKELELPLPYFLIQPGGSVHTNRAVIPYVYDLMVEDTKDKRFVDLTTLDNDDSGIRALAGSISDTPEKQAETYLQIMDTVVKVHENNPDLIKDWYNNQRSDEAWMLFVQYDHTDPRDIHSPLRPEEERLFNYDGAGNANLDAQDFANMWNARTGQLRVALASGNLEPYHHRWAEFMAHSVNVPEVIKLMQLTPAESTAELPFEPINNVDQLIERLNPELPENFRQEAAQVASWIKKLDAGEPLTDPEIRKFVQQLANSNFDSEVYSNSSLDPAKSLPIWLQDEYLQENGIQKYSFSQTPEVDTIAYEAVQNFGSDHSLAIHGPYVDLPPRKGVRVPTAQHFKVYIHGDQATKVQSGGFKTALEALMQSDINPIQMKSYDGPAIVMYFDQPVSNYDQISEIFKQNDIALRGPAQDVYTVGYKDGRGRMRSRSSNDGMLGGVDSYKLQWRFPNYNSTSFLASYLRLCLNAGKNPSEPYKTSFLYMLPSDFKTLEPAEIERVRVLAEQQQGYPVIYSPEYPKLQLTVPKSEARPLTPTERDKEDSLTEALRSAKQGVPEGSYDDTAEAEVKLSQNEQLEEISDEEAQEIMKKVEIEGDSTTGTANQEKKLTTETLVSEGLSPKYKITMGDTTVLFSSNPFNISNGRIAVIGYVQKNGRTLAHSFYRSNSQNVWRYLPFYTGGHWGKGHDEISVNLPIKLQQALSQISADEQNIKQVNDSRHIFLGTARTRVLSIPMLGEPGYGTSTEALYWKEIDSTPEMLQGNFYTTAEQIANQEKIPPEQVQFTNQEQAPDFSKVLSSWNLSSPIYGQVHNEVYPSKDGRYQYVFCRDNDGRAWIGGIEDTTSPLTSTGLRKSWVDAGELTTPAFEYSSQAGGYENPDKRIRGYVDVFDNYVSKIPVIKEYLASKQ